MTRRVPISRLTPDETARLVHHMAIAIRAGWPNDWERKFMAACIAQSRGRRGWQPTARQAPIMQRLVKRQLDELRQGADDYRAALAVLAEAEDTDD